MPNEKEQKPKEQKPKEPKPTKEPKGEPKGEPKAKEPKAKQPAAKTEEKGLLETAAEAIGSTLGTIAVKTGLAHPPKKKVGKLLKKNKSRLPRKEKKRARKIRGAAGPSSAK
jgi:hypothetical protein